MKPEIKIQLCKDDFYFMLENAMLQAGGGVDIDRLKRMTLIDIVNILPQNGIRMVYIPEKHMDAIKIVWENPRNNNTSFTPPNQPYSPPKKKQLLCDSLDHGDDDEHASE